MKPQFSSLDDSVLSNIRETFKFVKDDSDIVNLCIGDPDGAPPPRVIESYIRAIREGKTHYENDAGLPSLRNAVAQHENQLRNTCLHAYDNVVITNGGTNGIYSFSRAVLDPGDEVLLLDPVWIAFIQITKLLGCKPVLVPTCRENNFLPSIEELEQYVTPRTKVLVIVSPSNPSGAVVEEYDMKKLVDFCERKGIWLLHDEAYRDIVFDDWRQSSLVGHHPNVVGVRTLSKSHNMTGLRVGWVVSSNNELIEKVRKQVAYNVMCTNTAAQYAAVTAIEECKDWLDNTVYQYQKRLFYAVQRLRKMGFQVDMPRGSFYLFPRHKYGRSIAQEILEQSQVAVIDGEHFGISGRGHIRISCSVAPQALEQGLDRLEQWVSNAEPSSPSMKAFDQRPAIPA